MYISHQALSVGARTNSTIKCGGETYTYTAPALSYPSGTALNKTLIGSKTFRVYHDNGAGAKSVVVAASWAFNGTYSGTYVGTITASSTITLDAIPQQSAIASVAVTNDRVITVNLTRYVDTFTHTVTFIFGGHSYSVLQVGTSTSYTIPLDWFDAIPNSVSGVGLVQVTTYSGASPVGNTVSKEFIATLPASVVPSISGITWTRTSSEPTTWPLTKSVSTGVLSMTGVSGVYGSTIAAYSLTFAGLSSNATTLTVNNITSYGTLKAEAKVTDSRGRSYTKTVDFTVVDYGKPSLTVVAYRSNSAGKEDAVGEYVTITATVSAVLVGNNTITELSLQYKQHSSTSYTTTTLTSGTPVTIPASSDYTWDYIVTTADRVSTVTISGAVATGAVILDILADGTGITIGGVAEESGVHSKWDYTGKHITADKVTTPWVEAASVNSTDMSTECIYIEQMQVNNQDVVDFVVEQGTSGIWAYRKWYSGFAECWGKLTLSNLKCETAWGATLFDTPLIGQVAYPFTFKEAPFESISATPISGGSAFVIEFGGEPNTTTKSAGVWLARPSQTDIGSACITFDVKGRWK